MLGGRQGVERYGARGLCRGQTGANHAQELDVVLQAVENY